MFKVASRSYFDIRLSPSSNNAIALLIRRSLFYIYEKPNVNKNQYEFRTAPLLPDCCCVLADWSCLELLFVLTERHPFDAYVKHVASHLIERMKDYDVALTILIIQVLIFAEYFCYPD